MQSRHLLCHCSWILILFAVGPVRGDPAGAACSQLAAALPQRVAQPLSVQYSRDNTHWAGSSSQASRCSIEPASAAEVATIFHVINATRTPWAVKGGGHAYNPGFSSTPGVQVSMARFNTVTYDASTSTAHIGAGMIWDDVFAALEPHGVNVVGGRVPGVGVAGFALGGGYSWHTQQFGLTIDNVVSYDLITPTGNIMTVSDQSHPDLFFGLRGGGNNFGIITGVTMRTFPQTLVYGGALIYTGDLSAVTDAIVAFDANNDDPKACILANFNFIALTVEAVIYVFYDGPTAPSGTFDAFLNIPTLSNNVQTQSFPDFVQSLGMPPGLPRVGAHTVPIIQYTKPIVEQIINQTVVLGLEIVAPGLGVLAALSIECFSRSLYDRSRGGAYPHSAAHPWTPFQVLAGWLAPLDDTSTRAAILRAAGAVQRTAAAEGQTGAGAVLYNNYAARGTALGALYGANLPGLRGLRAQYDPGDLGGLAGGWRF